MNTLFNTLFIGKVLLSFDKLDSTNSEAERLLAQKKWAEGTVVVAKEQFAGRGQMGNSWHSQANKNITMSIILYPKIDFPQQQFLLHQIISLGVKDCLENLGLKNINIKWPNDILIHEKKIGGILIQNAISSKGISHSIIGIGLNVNQIEFPQELKNVTSIFKEQKKQYELNSIIEKLCFFIEKRYLELRAKKYKQLNDEYHQYLFLKNIKVLFTTKNNVPFLGKIEGVNQQGQIIIETSEGLKYFNFKEIQFPNEF